MSKDTVIRVQGLSKKYVLGRRGAYVPGLRHAIEDVVKAPFRMFRPRPPAEPGTGEEFWAVRDLTFEVKRGEVVGIIGRNGAGKSTLLKLLSRITEPTEGRIGINGRVSSLLEVGTGFHPELTGRENIFLNGAILGMGRAEIKRKLDEIVAFAGIERFLETPVKRYSSGMYVRLAFAIAANLDSDVLIVDEVLAVGDAEFQKKCLSKMREVTSAGRTVLFVSHDFAAVSALCERGMVLKNGRLAFEGATRDALGFYHQEIAGVTENPTAEDRNRRPGSGAHRLVSLRPAREEFPSRESVRFVAAIEMRRDEGAFNLAINICNEHGERLFGVNTEYLENGTLEPGDQEVEVTLEFPWLAPGDYLVNADLYAVGILDFWENACRFRIAPDVAKDGYSLASARQCGPVLGKFRAEVRRLTP
jgi:lipopolysaccharide transport system ATP-binding protein